MIRRVIIVISMLIFTILPMTLYAHSGNTDSQGGHHDYQNKSGLGDYHFHCDGNPPHLHDGGVCPYGGTAETEALYNYDKASYNNNDIPSSTGSDVVSSNENTVNGVETEELKITSDKSQLTVGEKNYLEIDFTPSNATDQNVVWESDDETVLTVSKFGEAIAVSPGKATVTATQGTLSDQYTIEVFAEISKLEIEDGKNVLRIKKGNREKLDITAFPNEIQQGSVEVAYDEFGIIDVDGDEIVALERGKVVLTATAVNGVKDTIVVRVYAIGFWFLPIGVILLFGVTGYVITRTWRR